MNDAIKAEKLALARKKLKEFENKRKTGPSPIFGAHSDGRCSSLSNGSVHSVDKIEANLVDREPFMVVNSNGSDTLHIDRQTNGSSVSSMNSSVVITNGTQDDNINTISHYSSAIEARLIQERDAAVQANEQLKGQLAELHAHYAHLHAAYSQLSQNGVHTDMEKQIIQLQSAFSVLVEEKTALQAELRTSKEQIEQLSASNLKSEKESDLHNEVEVKSLKSKLEQAQSLMNRQREELEQQRKIMAESQAKTLSVQNEKSEAQLRVKALLKEKDFLIDELTAVKKDLQMKNLHLKQLSMHQGQNPIEVAAQNDQIQSLTERLEKLTNELIAVRSERDVIIRGAESAKKQFEQYSAELAEKNGQLRMELENSDSQRVFSENRVQELEMQLTHQQINPNDSSIVSIPSPPENEEHLRRIRFLEEQVSDMSLQISLQKQKNKEQADRKAALLSQKEEELLNLSLKYRRLEERLNENRAGESELQALSKELQTEKATVSRAVAQNKELKEQLLELRQTEERLVTTKNEYMQCELDKQAAEHQVRQLIEQLSHLQNNPINNDSSDHLETSAVEALAMRNDREQELEQKLQQALQELTDVRQELRQSHSRNEQMNQIMMNNAEDENQNSIHVELGQALERMNQMAAENEQLREQLSASQQHEIDILAQLEATRTIQTTESPIKIAVETTQESQSPSETATQSSKETDIERWARTELEKKFTEAMRRNAELMDNMDKLEHINVQLQMENETIGDHVILYHQQRRIINDRLRVKDQQLMSMETEKMRVLERCRELQHTLKEVLASKEGSPLIRKVARSYSHSTVDEMSGDEDILVSNELPKGSSTVLDDDVISKEEGRTSPQIEETEAKVQRIFNILDEISTTPVANVDDLHCSHCTGELKKL